MKCARCGTSLDDGALVCGQCGAVVGVSYGSPSAPKTVAPKPPSAATPRPPSAFSPKSPGASAAGRARGLVERVKALLRSPSSEWPVIADEATTVMEIFVGYVAPLAAIGAVALFFGQVAIGSPVPLIGIVKARWIEGAAAGLVLFALSLLWVFVLRAVINALAPKFGGQPDAVRAQKVAAYAVTPLLLAGVLHAVPALGFLWVVAGLYSAYLAFVGLPLLMGCRKEQALLYAGVVALCAYVLLVVIGALTTAVTGLGPEYST